VKSTAADHVRVEARQLSKLHAFLSAFTLYPVRSAVVAVHFAGRGWVFRAVAAAPLQGPLTVRETDGSDWQP